jgi:hypothetical protein
MRHPRRKNDLMGSVVSRVLAALVERVNGGPEGWLGLPGARTPGGESRGHPLGGRNDPMVTVAHCVRKMLLQ